MCVGGTEDTFSDLGKNTIALRDFGKLKQR